MMVDEAGGRVGNTFVRLESDVEDAVGLLVQVSIALGSWRARPGDALLRAIAADAGEVADIAQRIKHLAEERLGEP